MTIKTFGILELDPNNRNSQTPLSILNYTDCFEMVSLHDKFAL